MDGFTIFLLVAAVVVLVATVYGLVRPRMGHHVDQNAIDSDARTNMGRHIHQTNRIHNDLGGGGGTGSF